MIQAQHVNYSPSKSNPGASKEPLFTYSIKIIPKKKSDYSIHKLHDVIAMYKSVEDLGNDVHRACGSKISLESLSLAMVPRGNSDGLYLLMISKICTVSIKGNKRYYCV